MDQAGALRCLRCFLKNMENEIDLLDIIPAQYVGSSMDAVEKRIFASQEEADVFFAKACERLLLINEWEKHSGISSFQLIDANGIRAERKAIIRDFIRIDIPGPGTYAGMGYDWVRIEDIRLLENSEQQILYMTVRPSCHPMDKDGTIAHFLKAEATSTFIVRKVKLEIFAEEHGRNELANTSDGSFLDKSRNLIVGIAAKIGLSYPQWKSLVKGLLRD